jgi:hypothetical protein
VQRLRFVRQDIPLSQQLVQAGHAIFAMCSLSPHGEGSPNIIVIGMPDLNGLLRVAQKLKREQIPHHDWHEPDGDLGFTAIATFPLHVREREPLANYRLWRYSPPTDASVVPSMASGEPNADVAQTRRESANGEHPLSKREVIGGSPIVGSTSQA